MYNCIWFIPRRRGDDRGGTAEDIVSIFNTGLAGISQLQEELVSLQEDVTALHVQIAALQQIVEENRLAMEQFNPLRKLLEELGSPEGIPGDVNNDGKVDQADLAILTSNWLKETP